MKSVELLNNFVSHINRQRGATRETVAMRPWRRLKLSRRGVINVRSGVISVGKK